MKRFARAGAFLAAAGAAFGIACFAALSAGAAEPADVLDISAEDNISCGSSINLLPGTQKTVYLKSDRFDYYQVLSTDLVSVKSVSTNVISLTAKEEGTTTLSASDSSGRQYKVTIDVSSPGSSPSVEDIVNYGFSAEPLSDSKPRTSNTRKIEVAAGTTVSFSGKDQSYTYRYSMMNSSGVYVEISEPSAKGSFVFSPYEAGKTCFRVDKINSQGKVARKEYFIITAFGTSRADNFAITYCRKGIKLYKGIDKNVTLPADISYVYKNSKTLTAKFQGKSLTLNESGSSNSDIIIVTKSGGIYPVTLCVNTGSSFEISQQEQTLEVGQQKTVSFTKKLNGYKYSFSSSAPTVVSVNENGQYKALKAGTAQITVSDRVGHSYSFKVNVNTTRITLSKTSATVKPGKTLQLKATIDSGSKTTYKFSSSNTKIATVSGSGLVTTHAKGSVVIKAATTNKKTAECKILVTDTDSKTTVKFDSVPPTVHVGKKVTVKLSASVSSAKDEIVCTSSDTSVAAVSCKNGVCTIEGKGMGKATITAKLPNGKKATQYVYSVGNYDDYRTMNSVEKGVDISCFNENVNYKALKDAGYTFVIIRSGYGSDADQKDEYFEKHIKGAKAAGLGIGIYHFSYALTVSGAHKEADFCNKIISKYRDDIKYGVYFDYEYASADYAEYCGYTVNKDLVTNITLTFCRDMEKYGFVAGVYTNTDFGRRYYDMKAISQYLFWYALPDSTDFAYDFDLWQYSFTERPKGTTGVFDANKIFTSVFKRFK